MAQPVFRFAPSPTGYLHAGHAYAALVNQKMCRVCNGRMLLRLENTDLSRCRREFESAIIEDLRWIGFEWQGEIRRQSEHFQYYEQVKDKLIDAGLIYPSFLSRGEIRREVERLELAGLKWPRDPDGVVHYPGNERDYRREELAWRCEQAHDFAWRLDQKEANRWLVKHGVGDLFWRELVIGDMAMAGAEVSTCREKKEKCDLAAWGDVVLARKNIPARYHLAGVIDDGLQGISHVVRGRDLFAATSIHRTIQEILGLPMPVYFHHELLKDSAGKKLAKSRASLGLRDLRESGMKVEELHDLIGFRP